MKCSQENGSSIFKRPFSGCTVVLLVAALISVKGYAKPTISTNNNLSASQLRSSSIFKMTHTIDFLGNGDNKLLNIGSEITKPRAALAGSTDVYEHHIEPLPAVPAALLMVMVGFLCISFVRDRRLWLMVLSGIFWAGNTGLCAVPQLAKHIYNKAYSHRNLPAKTAWHHLLKHTCRERCDLEGTRYVALINYLESIPKCNFTPRIRLLNSSLIGIGQDTGKFKTIPFAIINLLSHLKAPISKPPPVRNPFLRFLPAFIFNRSARGPPVIS